MGSSPGQNPANSEVSPVPTKRFKCDTCQRHFNRREHLQRHESTHNNNKPFHCTLCRYSCRRRDLLNRHIKLSHPRKRVDHECVPADPSENLQNASNEVGAAEPALLDCNTNNPTCPTEQAPPGSIDSVSAPSMPTQLNEQPRISSFPNEVQNASAALPFLGIEESSQSFSLNYLDNVYLPPYYNQPASYPDLNIEAFMSLVDDRQFHFDQEGTTGQPTGDLPPGGTQMSVPKPTVERNKYIAHFARVSPEDWQWLFAQVSKFSHVLPADYELPSRHAISRYMFGFLTGFYPHFPIIHPPTLSFQKMAPELILALAAVGSNYCLELHQGMKIFPIAKSIAMERIRCREIHMQTLSPHANSAQEFNRSPATLSNQNQTLRDDVEMGDGILDYQGHDEDLETMQALFFLMAMATWGGERRSLVRQAIATQSTLAMLVRQHGHSEPSTVPLIWEDWARAESARRTKLVIFCFFNLHTIAFNIPSPMLIADIQLRIPCAECEWEAPDAARWKAVNKRSPTPPLFQGCFTQLFQEIASAPMYSSLGGYVLVSALLQRIISIQQSIRLEGVQNEMPPALYVSLRRALQKWQSGWEQNPESSYSPLDNHGPIAFNSRALYHLAYVRLAMDIGPARSILNPDATQIARRLFDAPRLQCSSRLLLAAKHAAAALCSPVQMGVHFVGRAPSWSVMHAVCSLDYAYALSQFLQNATLPNPEFPLEEEDRALLATIKETLCEVETSMPSGNTKLIETHPRLLGAKAVRAWAMILDGMRTWNAVCLVTKVLFIYADLLEHNFS
ncbi:hypothetical protein BJX64DRAFT_259273 [Aspergillus heterothallicus]